MVCLEVIWPLQAAIAKFALFLSISLNKKKKTATKIRENCLYYYTTREDILPTGLIKLSGAKVKISDIGKLYCFEVVTPQREWVLQAEDSSDMSQWMEIIQQSIKLYADGKIDRVSQRSCWLDWTFWTRIDDIFILFFFESLKQQIEQASSPAITSRKSMVLKENFIRYKGYLMKQGRQNIDCFCREFNLQIVKF